MTSETYVIRGGAEGRERLRLLSEVMGASTRSFLAALDVPRGAACLDVGCGGGDVTRELARLVGAAGRVVGVDRDEATLAIARREAADEGLAQVAFERHDVVGWEPEGRFDLIYSRFLLTHLADPGALLATLCRHLRPGGVLALEDVDFRGHFSEPDCTALGRFVELYGEAVRRRGGDANVGPRLPGLLHAAGLDGVAVRVFHPVDLAGGIKELTCVTLETIADAVLEQRLATPDELRDTIDGLRAFAADPRTVIGGPRVFQVRARAGSCPS